MRRSAAKLRPDPWIEDALEDLSNGLRSEWESLRATTTQF